LNENIVAQYSHKNIPDGIMPVQTLSEEQRGKFNADRKTKIKDVK
jgi:hypothetical protein